MNSSFRVFHFVFVFLASPTLTIMHLRIMLNTYWTPPLLKVHIE